mmetsp:Transcript_49094/g.110449  ORF Transcript_49094/g.110449 Transcript_49094/m.110449 type:complete len:227 (+) Transcript_49094:434-1114(+)
MSSGLDAEPALLSKAEQTTTCSKPSSSTLLGFGPLKKSSSRLFDRFTRSSVSKALPWKMTRGFPPVSESLFVGPKLDVGLKPSTPNSCMSSRRLSKSRPKMSRNGRFFELEPKAKRLWSYFLQRCSSRPMSSNGWSWCLFMNSVDNGLRILCRSRSRFPTSMEDLLPRMISAVLASSKILGSLASRNFLPLRVLALRLPSAAVSAPSDIPTQHAPPPTDGRKHGHR